MNKTWGRGSFVRRSWGLSRGQASQHGLNPTRRPQCRCCLQLFGCRRCVRRCYHLFGSSDCGSSSSDLSSCCAVGVTRSSFRRLGASLDSPNCGGGSGCRGQRCRSRSVHHRDACLPGSAWQTTASSHSRCYPHCWHLRPVSRSAGLRLSRRLLSGCHSSCQSASTASSSAPYCSTVLQHCAR